MVMYNNERNGYCGKEGKTNRNGEKEMDIDTRGTQK